MNHIWWKTQIFCVVFSRVFLSCHTGSRIRWVISCCRTLVLPVIISALMCHFHSHPPPSPSCLPFYHFSPGGVGKTPSPPKPPLTRSTSCQLLTRTFSCCELKIFTCSCFAESLAPDLFAGSEVDSKFK